LVCIKLYGAMNFETLSVTRQALLSDTDIR
jgi:hypothetical protein